MLQEPSGYLPRASLLMEGWQHGVCPFNGWKRRRCGRTPFAATETTSNLQERRFLVLPTHLRPQIGFDFDDHRCPHDAWLETLDLSELSSGERGRERNLSVSVRLLGAYHHGFIELRYPRVFSYTLNVSHSERGHSNSPIFSSAVQARDAATATHAHASEAIA
jgi:hypothetical protein